MKNFEFLNTSKLNFSDMQTFGSGILRKKYTNSVPESLDFENYVLPLEMMRHILLFCDPKTLGVCLLSCNYIYSALTAPDKIMLKNKSITRKRDIIQSPSGLQSNSDQKFHRSFKETYHVLPNGKRHGPYKRYNRITCENVVKGQYVDGKKEGIWIICYTYSGTQFVLGEYRNGLKNGCWVTYINNNLTCLLFIFIVLGSIARNCAASAS